MMKADGDEIYNLHRCAFELEGDLKDFLLQVMNGASS
jgi:hypothetical protein